MGECGYCAFGAMENDTLCTDAQYTTYIQMQCACS